MSQAATGLQQLRITGQVLLRFLSQRPGISKFAIEGDRPGEDTHDFLLNQFKINFKKGDNDTETFFDSLYHHCAEAKMLRPLVNLYAGAQTRIMRLAYAGKLATALDELLPILQDPDDRDEVTMLSGRLREIEQQQKANSLDSRDFWVEWNKIAFAIIHLSKKIEP